MVTTLMLGVALGAVAGLRTLVPLATVAWGAYLGRLDLATSPVFFLAHSVSVVVFTFLAMAELVADKVPSCPARTSPFQFGSRLASGTFCGAVLGFAASVSPVPVALSGLIGAGIGTWVGFNARATLAQRLGRDRPAALIEDATAILLAALLFAGIAGRI